MKNCITSTCVSWCLVAILVLYIVVQMILQRPTKNSPEGFVLPAGDARLGQQAFVDLGCIECHSVYSVKFEQKPAVAPEMNITIGGVLNKPKTYGQLVTDIIHPTESIRTNNNKYTDSGGHSLMPIYGKIMTVEQLTHLVSFLLDYYEVWVPEPQHYQMYPYNVYTPNR
ncbi:MAG: hypothetical protein ACI81V_000656 [Lentimonas sp.]|jgi:hypothetical protein